MIEDTLESRRLKLEESMKELAKAFHGMWIVIKETCMEHWDEIKELAELLTEKQILIEDKPIWHTPKRLGHTSQVMNRRPLVIRARSCC